MTTRKSNSFLRSWRFSVAVAMVGMIFCSAVALAEAHGAAPGGHGGEAAHHGPSLLLLWTNFGIYAGLMYFLLRKPLAYEWHARRETIEHAINRSQILLREAQKEYDSAVAAESMLEERLVKERRDVLEVARIEVGDILSAANERSARVIDQAGQLVEAERSRRLDEVRREFSHRVIAEAEQIVRRQLSDDTDGRIRSAVLADQQGIAALVQS